MNGANATWPDISHGNLYRGYVWGAAVVMNDAGWIDSGDVTNGQIYVVVGKYLDNHPEQWNLPAEVLVYRALYAAWPGTKASPYR
jgi:hypothetical protein